MNRKAPFVAVSAGAAGLCVARAGMAQSPPPSYGIDFMTVGAPGNRAAIPGEVPSQPDLVTGAVSYTYRISKTEIDESQWVGFVNAFAPYWTGSPGDVAFTSLWIDPSPNGYVIEPGAEHYPVTTSWEMAARYCNWLSNGQGTQQSAFESGAYDTSTFTANPDGSLNDQLTRSPGAKFWIPSRDEWAKAAYYDPNRNGTGVGGYWRFPNMTDQELVSGLPGQGGQTNAGQSIPSSILAMDVGSYPTVQSPWGLLDLSGGVQEWTEDTWFGPGHRWCLGTRMNGILSWDRIDWEGLAVDPLMPLAGLRIVSSIPEPAAGIVVCTFLVGGRRRSRSCGMLGLTVFSPLC